VSSENKARFALTAYRSPLTAYFFPFSKFSDKSENLDFSRPRNFPFSAFIENMFELGTRAGRRLCFAGIKAGGEATLV
jgi:hypothetical protein